MIQWNNAEPAAYAAPNEFNSMKQGVIELLLIKGIRANLRD